MTALLGALVGVALGLLTIVPLIFAERPSRPRPRRKAG
jgi:hypothetical protein